AGLTTRCWGDGNGTLSLPLLPFSLRVIAPSPHRLISPPRVFPHSAILRHTALSPSFSINLAVSRYAAAYRVLIREGDSGCSSCFSSSATGIRCSLLSDF